MPAIIRMGGPSTRSWGAPGSAGTKLVSVSGHVRRPGNYEVELGTPSREIIFAMAAGRRWAAPVNALVPGGS